MVKVQELGFETRAIHAGQAPDPSTGALVVPISLSTTFEQSPLAPGQGSKAGYEYSRSDNPTRRALETCLASLDGAKYGLTFSSGLAAITAIFQALGASAKVIVMDDVYGGTNRACRKVLSRTGGLVSEFVDLCEPPRPLAEIFQGARLVWIETPSNPTLKVVDIEAVCSAAHAQGALVVVDNTFATPFFQLPLKQGADIVMYSATKYINGHSDIVMGSVALNDDRLYEELRFLQNAVGGVPSPFDCFLCLRGIKTLGLRMQKHAQNAMAVARALEEHPKVERVSYPGLPSHPSYAIAQKQMSGFSGMVTVWLKGVGEEGGAMGAATRFLQRVRVFRMAESLGAVESLVEHPATMTHASVPAQQRQELGIDDAMLRLSVGIEDQADLVRDVVAALQD